MTCLFRCPTPQRKTQRLRAARCESWTLGLVERIRSGCNAADLNFQVFFHGLPVSGKGTLQLRNLTQPSDSATESINFQSKQFACGQSPDVDSFSSSKLFECPKSIQRWTNQSCRKPQLLALACKRLFKSTSNRTVLRRVLVQARLDVMHEKSRQRVCQVCLRFEATRLPFQADCLRNQCNLGFTKCARHGDTDTLLWQASFHDQFHRLMLDYVYILKIT